MPRLRNNFRDCLPGETRAINIIYKGYDMSTFTCPANPSIQCDQLYELGEFERQLRMSMESNKESYFFIGRHGPCQVDKSQCPRYLAALRQMKRQR